MRSCLLVLEEVTTGGDEEEECSVGENPQDPEAPEGQSEVLDQFLIIHSKSC